MKYKNLFFDLDDTILFGPFLKMLVTPLRKYIRNIRSTAILIHSIIIILFINKEIPNSGLSTVKER